MQNFSHARAATWIKLAGGGSKWARKIYLRKHLLIGFVVEKSFDQKVNWTEVVSYR